MNLKGSKMRNICKTILLAMILAFLVPTLLSAQYITWPVPVKEDSTGTVGFPLGGDADVDTALTYYDIGQFDHDEVTVELRYSGHADSNFMKLYVYECYSYPDSAIGSYWFLSDSIVDAASVANVQVHTLTLQGGKYITFSMEGLALSKTDLTVYLTMFVRYLH